ncbi:MAG: hypothetical protein ACYDDO_04650 [Acidiferrobacterales bacterium]
MNKTTICTAVGLILGMSSVASYAATVYAGNVLTITTGVPAIGTTASGTAIVTGFSGSYFGVDTNGDSKISQTEKAALSQGTTGLVIGTTTADGASHLGAPVAGDTNTWARASLVSWAWACVDARRTPENFEAVGAKSAS